MPIFPLPLRWLTTQNGADRAQESFLMELSLEGRLGGDNKPEIDRSGIYTTYKVTRIFFLPRLNKALPRLGTVPNQARKRGRGNSLAGFVSSGVETTDVPAFRRRISKQSYNVTVRRELEYSANFKVFRR